MSLPESLERAATELPDLADDIRPANGDPHRLLDELAGEAAARLLIWLLDQAPADAEELVEAWEERDEGVALLLSARGEGLSKGGRKLLRRAHHRLRSRGLEVAAADSPTVKKRIVTGQGDRWQAGYVSAPDFRGARMGYLVDSHPSSGARLFEVRFDEGRGMLDFKVYNSSRSKVRGFLKSLVERSGRRLFEVDRDALRALIWRAARAQPLDRPLPTGFVEWRARLFGDDLEKQETPGERARRTIQAAEPEAARETLAELIRAGRVGPWPPTSEWVGDRMDRGRDSVEGLEGDARGAAIEAWIAEVSTALNADSDQALIARHLEELAWVEGESGETGQAGALLAVAAALPEDGETAAIIGRARVESLFEPFLSSLRVIEQDALAEDAGAGSTAG
jgi:hypothetical protein